MFREQAACFRGRAVLGHDAAQGVLMGVVGKDIGDEETNSWDAGIHGPWGKDVPTVMADGVESDPGAEVIKK